MRALRFTRFGPPEEVLTLADVTDPDIGGGEALVAVKAASVNPSDLKNVTGDMEGTVLPRIPGRDFAGVVVGGPRDWIGAEVYGTGGDVGFSRDGTHAELVGVPSAALVRKPERLSFAEAAVLGVPFVVGWLGAVETALLEKGETIAVFGVGGGVGSAVAQIARVRGARVIGVDRTAPADHAPVDHFVPLDDDTGAEVRRLTGGAGADVVYDAVGGVTTPAALDSLARRGRLVVISAIGTRTVTLDLIDFYHREARMLGSDSRRLDAVRCAELLSRFTPYLEAGDFRPPRIACDFSLPEAGDAYAAVARRPRGRVVIRP
ncbi:quinone oxidoreductase family protein [Herbidospora mongoliensis]|uniref:quinone oxidoreductase family protein n=1 Tax=Herbidospora mongoliensis TaxID=688067 RepID=UPI000835A76F|nr:zinc-binding alcohol dehydrogenase family protein [Herbidospora mongoliensis]